MTFVCHVCGDGFIGLLCARNNDMVLHFWNACVLTKLTLVMADEE